MSPPTQPLRLGLKFSPKRWAFLDYNDKNIQNESDKSCGLEVSQLEARFYMERPLGHSMIEIYIPSVCIVLMSWVNFWLSRSATPERVGLAMTIVLTLTTLMTNANANLPKTSYPKVISTLSCM